MEVSFQSKKASDFFPFAIFRGEDKSTEVFVEMFYCFQLCQFTKEVSHEIS